MECPHLTGDRMSRCKAGTLAYAPSLFQLHEYCRGKGYKKCPFFLRSVREKYTVSSSFQNVIYLKNDRS